MDEQRLTEIRALTWDWLYEDCSDHQGAVDDLLSERDELLARLAQAEQDRDEYAEQLASAREVVQEERDNCEQYAAEGRLLRRVAHPLWTTDTSEWAKRYAPLIAAEVERVKALEAVVETARALSKHPQTSGWRQICGPLDAALAKYDALEADHE